MQPRLAVAAPDREPVDLADAWARHFGEAPDPAEQPYVFSTLALIENGEDVWATVAEVASAAGPASALDPLSPEVSLLCPLDRLASLRDFLAFESHVEKGAQRRGGEVPSYWYEAPVYYKGNHRQIIGPDETVAWPRYSGSLDFELELAMVVGRRGRDLDAASAPSHVFGFTVMNDLSARDVQAREMTAWLGPAKAKDFATALGPCIVTADEVGAEPDLAMVCRVDGKEWGRARSSEAHWSWADMLVHVSAAEDVYPGDVYGSGTPGGCCGLDQGRLPRPGAVIELEIERIGTLRNTLGPRPLISSSD